MATLAGIIGESASLDATRRQLSKILEHVRAGQRLPPLFIQGDTGAGKSMLARSAHAASPRAAAPFVGVNCAAIPATLLESELFGHERGAFTGAQSAKTGLFQSANGGTLFLDEVGFLPEALQAKLLTAIEDRAVRKVGATRPEATDVWILSATSMDMKAALAEHRFLEPLYHRLAVMTVSLPPLRERGRDILLLAEHFLARVCADYKLGSKRMTAEAHAALLAHAWPGNVRELGNVIERAALLVEGDSLDAAALGLPAAPAPAQPSASAPTDDDLTQAMERSKGNLSRAAALLGIPRNTLRYRLTRAQARSAPAPAVPPAPAPASASASAPAPAPAPAPRRAARDSLRWERQTLALLRAELDPAAATGDIVEVLVEKVQAFGGRVEDLGPSGLLAVFGVEPLEDPARRAAHAARALVRAADGHELRVGLHAGQILVGHGAGDARLDVAGRRELERALDPLLGGAAGVVRVSPGAAALLRRRFDVAGEGDTLRLESGERAGFAAASDLVGRAGELGLLLGRWEAAREGRGQVVALVGEAGIGKSRLLHELRRRCAPPVTLEGRCQAYGTTVPYLPIIDLVRQACELGDDDPGAVLEAKLGAALARLGVPGDGVPILLQLLGVSEGTERVADLAPEAARARTESYLKKILLAVAARAPLLVIVDDIHWIDPPSEALLVALIESLEAASILLCVTYRPGRPPPTDRSIFTQIALQPLGAGDSARLVERVLEGATPRVVAEIVARGQGNALFLEELARVAGEGGSVRVPETLHAVIEERIKRLPDAPRRLLRTASVLGREAGRALLERIWDGGDLDAHLAELRRAELVHERPIASADPAHVFKHALVQEVAYEGLLPAERLALHGAAGHALEELYRDRVEQIDELLAHHFQRSAFLEKAVDYLYLANRHAGRVYAMVPAYAHYQAANALLDRMPVTPENRRRRLELLVIQHDVMLLLGKNREYHEELVRYEPDAVALGDPALLAGYYSTRSILRWSLGAFDDGVADGHIAITHAAAARSAYHEGYAMLAWNLASRGDLREAVALEGAILESTRRWRHALVAAGNLGALMFAHEALGDHERAVALGEEAVAMAEAADDASALSLAAWHLSRAHNLRGDLAAARAAAERAAAAALGPAAMAWAMCHLAWAWSRGGEPARAIEVLRPVILGARQMGFVPIEDFSLYLGEAFVLAGQRDAAREWFAESLAIAERHGMKLIVGVLHRWLGTLAPDPATARRHLVRAVDILTAIGAAEEIAQAQTALRALAD